MAMVDGRTLLARSLQAIAPSCLAAAVNADPASGAAKVANEAGYEVVSDDPAHPQGPLAGVAAGLLWARREGLDGLITLPSDTPFVGAEIVAGMTAAIGESAACYAVSFDGPHWLCAVWTVGLGADLEHALAKGAHPAVGAFLQEVGARAVMFPEPARFTNVNRPSDLIASTRGADREV